MNASSRRNGTLGAALVVGLLPAVASAQMQSELTRSMGITQKLGEKAPLDVPFMDETGKVQTLGSLSKGRPLLVVPVPLRREAGCGIIVDSLQKTLYRADHANERKLFKKEGENRLLVGKTFDLVFLSLDPLETPVDAAVAKNEFTGKIGYNPEGVTFLTTDRRRSEPAARLADVRRVTDALGFKFFYDPATKVLRNATGSALITPDGRISSYTIGNDFPTIVLEKSLDIAAANGIGDRADDTEMFGCVQLDPKIVARRGKIEGIYTVGALATLGVVAVWISSMLRSERNRNRDLGGQPGGA